MLLGAIVAHRGNCYNGRMDGQTKVISVVASFSLKEVILTTPHRLIKQGKLDFPPHEGEGSWRWGGGVVELRLPLGKR